MHHSLSLYDDSNHVRDLIFKIPPEPDLVGFTFSNLAGAGDGFGRKLLHLDNRWFSTILNQITQH